VKFRRRTIVMFLWLSLPGHGMAAIQPEQGLCPESSIETPDAAMDCCVDATTADGTGTACQPGQDCHLVYLGIAARDLPPPGFLKRIERVPEPAASMANTRPDSHWRPPDLS
jgi:hypothetical protein